MGNTGMSVITVIGWGRAKVKGRELCRFQFLLTRMCDLQRENGGRRERRKDWGKPSDMGEVRRRHLHPLCFSSTAGAMRSDTYPDDLRSVCHVPSLCAVTCPPNLQFAVTSTSVPVSS